MRGGMDLWLENERFRKEENREGKASCTPTRKRSLANQQKVASKGQLSDGETAQNGRRRGKKIVKKKQFYR